MVPDLPGPSDRPPAGHLVMIQDAEQTITIRNDECLEGWTCEPAGGPFTHVTAPAGLVLSEAVQVLSDDMTVDLNAANAEFAYSYAGNDTLDASATSYFVELYGGEGNDILRAGSGGSIMVGDNGTDTLQAGNSTDHLVGGALMDTFRFSDNSGTDYIYDWQDGIDRIDLSAVTGVAGFSDLTIDTAYSGINWYGVSYDSGVVWVQTGGVGSLDASDFIY